MRPAIGSRDNLITFRRRTGTQNAKSGAWTYTWADVAPQEWAEVQALLPSRSESVSDNIDMTRRPRRIRCSYREDITPDMRAKIDGRELEIVSGPIMLGRRDGLEMIAVELSTEGEAP